MAARSDGSIRVDVIARLPAPRRSSERPGGVRFSVHVQPRAKRDAIVGVHGAALKVRLAASPIDGAANAALIALLAAALDVPRRDVRIITGMMSREKIVEIDGIDAARIIDLARSHT